MRAENCSIEELRRRAEKLPIKAQTSLLWIVEHLDSVNKMVDEEPLSEEERTEFLKFAKEKEDYMMQLLILYEKMRHEP